MEQKAVEIKQKLKEAEAKAGASELSTLKVQEEELKRQEEEFARKEAELIKKERVIISCESGVERFVSFGHTLFSVFSHHFLTIHGVLKFFSRFFPRAFENEIHNTELFSQKI